MVIQGARPIGMTWLMKEYGRREHEQTAYFSFENTRELYSIFKIGYDNNRTLTALNILFESAIDPSNTLIIFDEIQSFLKAITS